MAGAPSSEDSDVACLPVSVALAPRSRDWPARCWLLVRSFESAEGRSGPPRELAQVAPAASCGPLSGGLGSSLVAPGSGPGFPTRA